MKNICMALVCLVMTACASKELSHEELIRYISDEGHGLRKSVTVNGVAIEIAYRPTDMLVHREIMGELSSAGSIDSLRSKYGRYHYFVLSFSRSGKEVLDAGRGMSEYSGLLQTMSFRMAEYVTLTSPTDSIPVGDFLLNRTYGLGNSTEILFAFNREKAAGEEWVQFNLNEFGLGTGNQRFRFRKEDLERTPVIRFTSRQQTL